jgi:hypothetical protein
MKGINKLFAWLLPELNAAGNAVPSKAESAFFGKECVKCGDEFDVPPSFAFDRRREHYCEDCMPCP